MIRAPRPCLVCGTPAAGSYCPSHRRDRNLASRSLAIIADRDGWVCQICGQPVSHTRDRAPGSPSLDHVIPLAQGGPDAMSNLRLTHLACNARRR
ncbi:MAG: HNH endonuclease [Acidimicrobiia bacterium]